ncbi:DUF4333 domain-containing protein [Mycolicibacterium fortuitum]|uniref:DUF4333 domain-containing protein n=1 Tax=Mycolicibacterium fortuitum TaxID=1766 RepID=UPI00260E18D7|nr:DUF4333 domain-containing protein [Mycolicibacterium fortuitum]
MQTRSIRALVGVALVGVSALLGACSAHVEFGGTGGGVDKNELAKVVKQRVEEQAGVKAEKVECEDHLPAKVGAVQRCVLTESGKKYGVTVTADAVEGTKVKFNIKVDGKPMATV